MSIYRQKIIHNSWLLAFMGFVAFAVLIFTLNLPAQIAIGEKGQHAIKMLDAVRRQFLEIKKEEALLIWTDDITRPTTSELHKAIETGNALFANYRQSAGYNPELLRQAVKLSESYENWIKTEQRLLERFQKMSAGKHANGVNAQILMEMNTASGMFLYAANQLSEAEGFIYMDIDRGRRASHILIVAVGGLFIYLIGLIFLQQRYRRLELESQIEMRTYDLNEANKNLKQEIQYHKQAEEALKNSEHMHRLVLDNISEIIYMIKTTADNQFGGDIIFVSNGVKNFLGYEPQEFQRNPNLWFGLVHPEDISVLKEATYNIYTNRKPGTRIYRIRHKDNEEYRWIEDRVVPQLDDAGSLIGIFGVARDITEQKRSEEALVVSEEKFRMLAQQSITGICITQDGKFIYVNPHLAEMLDYKQEEMLGSKVLDFVAEQDRDTVNENMRKRTSGEVPYVHYTFSALKKSGLESQLEVHGSVMKYRGSPAIMATVLDVTERGQKEAEIKKTLSLLNATLESTTDGILVVNGEGKMTSFNKRFVNMWHLPESIIESMDDNKALAFVLEQLKYPDEFIGKVKELYSNPYTESFDVLEFKDGRVFERYSRPQLIGGKSVGRVWSFRDVTERRRAEGKIQHMAYHDALTELPNRTLFYDRLQQATLYAQRANEQVVLMFLDLDDFKKVNDTYGHHYGDLLLKQLGHRIKGVLRGSDTVARMGGDEFAIILQQPEKAEGAVRTVEKVVEAISTPFCLEKITLNVKASIGIAIFPDHGEDINSLMQRADTAMYTAKRSGRDFVIYGG